jgi:putative photosynthetic complex assembly protein
VFFFANKGFYSIDASGSMTPIGRERVDRTFLADFDATDHSLLQAAADPRSNRVFFAYKSQDNALKTMDKGLVYDYILDRWSPVTFDAEIITSLAKPGITLEGLATIGSRAVSNAVDNGAGLVRLTVSATTSWATGDIKTIASVGGTTEANGTFTITVIDATTNEVAVVLAPGSNGFLRGALRALTRSRLAAGIGQTEPFRLVRYTDGRLVLHDDATTQQVTITSFGPTQIESFDNLLKAKPGPGPTVAPPFVPIQ